MKKILLSIIYFLACIFSIQAQTLYGTTYGSVSPGAGRSGAGTINKFIASANDLIVLKSFEGIPSRPVYTNVIQATDGKLYGMTSEGGRSGLGVIFSYDPISSSYKQLKDFGVTDLTEGAISYGSLMQANNGKLYGMTSQGGSSNAGVIFSYDPLSSTYKKLKDFDRTNGAHPVGSLIQASDGKLYGMTFNGEGNSLYGVIFSFDLTSSTYAKLKDFDSSEGANPNGSLIQANDGKLYGMTRYGGSSNNGVIFSFDLSSSAYTKLKDFNPADGDNPYGSLMQADDGKLYGMTHAGGSNDVGVIFSLDPSGFNYTKLADFDDIDGSSPYGNLIKATDGKLYGLASQGGNGSFGVIFSFDVASSTYAKLKRFEHQDGSSPFGSLLQARDGKLYGMTTNGGLSDAGVIFSFDPSTSTYTKLKDLGTNESGSNPSSSLIQTKDGKFYGMTSQGGSSGVGVIYSFDPFTSTYTKVKDFDNTNGANPWGSLMQARDGKLYGMTHLGGSMILVSFFLLIHPLPLIKN